MYTWPFLSCPCHYDRRWSESYSCHAVDRARIIARIQISRPWCVSTNPTPLADRRLRIPPFFGTTSRPPLFFWSLYSLSSSPPAAAFLAALAAFFSAFLRFRSALQNKS